MKKKCFLLIVVLSLLCFSLRAQSLSYAQSLIDEGRYREAAVIIRPLADGGNAEAQLMAAKMFYEDQINGKNNRAQFVKYATLSANQGNEEAIFYLTEGYLRHRPDKEIFSCFKKWTDSHPKLLKTKTGAALAEFYMYGTGCEVNEDKAWQILEGNEYEALFIEREPSKWQTYQQRHPELFTIHDSADQMPSFPGGPSALNSYLANEITYPAICINNKIQGRPIVQFVVERNGSISSAKIVRSVDPALDKEALRVISSMPKWNPGKKNGVPVRVKYTIPVTFKLPNKR